MTHDAALGGQQGAISARPLLHGGQLGRRKQHLEALLPGAQLGVAGGAVGVQLVRLRVDRRRPPLQRLRVVLHRLRVPEAAETQRSNSNRCFAAASFAHDSRLLAGGPGSSASM